MDIILSFTLFLLLLLICLIKDITMVLPIGLGVLIFGYCAIKRGYAFKEVKTWALESVKDSMIVVRILLLIGCMTGLWRASGTIAYFVSLGIQLIPGKLFILAAFVLAALMSYALGTSFGITATCGVILMAIARAGGANPIVAAGAVLSGVYVGDRGSPAASSANLVAVLTKTDMKQNVRLMMKDAIVPLALTLLLYAGLSFIFPMGNKDLSLLSTMESAFHMSWICLLPAVIMLVLPLAGINIASSMLLSIIVCIFCCLFVQNLSLVETMRAMIFGYIPKDASLVATFSGGGIQSMIEICLILILSGSYGGIFKGAKLLSEVDALLVKLQNKIGRFGVINLVSILVCGVFCNQTIGIIMLSVLTDGLYKEEEKTMRMRDVENSVVMIAGLVPWCIACSVPLSMLGANFLSLPFAFYLYLIPIWHYVTYQQRCN